MAVTAEEMKAWLDKNKDKAGTPDYVQVTEDYTKATAAPRQPAAPVAPDPSNPAGVSPEQSTPFDTATERFVASRANESPNSVGNIAGRAVTSAVSGVPDLGIGLLNVGQRAVGRPEFDYLSPKLNAIWGGKGMAQDAPWWQRGGEGVLAGATGGLLGGARGVVGSLLPSVTGWAGAEGGAKLGEAAGVDPQLMAMLGGLVGGQARPIAQNIGRGTIAAFYGGHGKPNAGDLLTMAERQDVTPTGALLGDQSVGRLEQLLERRPGSGPNIVAAKELARNQITQAARAVPPSQGATMNTPAQIGRATQGLAEESLVNLENKNSVRQQQMQNQMDHGNAPIDVGGVDRTMADIVGPHPSQSDLSPGAVAPIAAKLAELREMYPPADPNVQGPVQPGRTTAPPVVRQAPFVSWRNDLLTSRDANMRPMTRAESVPITTEARRTYQDTANQYGVDPGQFDATQMRSRLLSDEQRPALLPLTSRDPGGTTDYSTVYNRGVGGADTNPQSLVDFRNAVQHGVGAGPATPRVNDIFASRLNDMINETLLHRNESALGLTKYDQAVRGIDPQSLTEMAGPVGARTITDTGALAGALHRPTAQGGGTRALIDTVSNVTNRFGLPALAGAVSHLLGMDPSTTAATAAATAALPIRPIDLVNRGRAAMLNSQTAANVMAGRGAGYQGVNINDLVSSINAMQGSTPYGPRQ